MHLTVFIYPCMYLYLHMVKLPIRAHLHGYYSKLLEVDGFASQSLILSSTDNSWYTPLLLICLGIMQISLLLTINLTLTLTPDKD